ncbi:MAG: DUF533 domain-containing protein [Bdellovibrionota bacterium]|nr:DUF533 domain-containing protein [Bdellovibrionota bacterium]
MSVYDESKFNVWRACIGVIWSDGKVDPQERSWIEDRINKLLFTPEQKEILKSDLETNIDFKAVVDKISRPADRAFLVHQIRVISHMDGHQSPEEQKLLKTWSDYVLNKVDASALEQFAPEQGIKTKKDIFDLLEKELF